MKGKSFLNPIVKIILCAIGMVTMGYFLYPVLLGNIPWDRLAVVRGLVFLGFTYLFVQSFKDLAGREGS
jgi:hypothetical protein